MKLRHYAYCTTLTAVLVGCGNFSLTGDFSDRLDNLPGDLRGIWQTNGYGYVVDVTDETIVSYDATRDICIRNDDAVEDVLHIFEQGGLRFSEDKKTLFIATRFEPHEIQAKRLSALPAICGNTVPDTPLGNFDVFASFFREHYAFFDLYGVNWREATSAARKQIGADTTDGELFQIMSRLLQPLKDGHVHLNAKVGRKDVSYEPNKGKTQDALNALANRDGISEDEIESRFQKGYWRDDVAGSILGGAGTLAGNDFIQYGVTSEDIGYLAFVTVAGYATGDVGAEQEDLAVLNATMERALAEFDAAGVKAVILDLSVNYGGYDFISRAIAGRFAATRSKAYSKRAGDAAGATFFPLYVTPASGRRFEGPVYVMTSDVTVSGGEILTMSLRSLPNVTHVGEATRGALSDVLDKQLPNGWELSLSNEIYADHKGIKWEGRGVKPEISIPVFNPQNPLEGHLEAVSRLIALIDRKHGN